MNLFIKYLKNYKKECVLAPLFKMLEASFELFIPLVIASIIDKGIGQAPYGNADKSHIYRMCLVLFILALVGLAFSITAQYFSAKAATGFSKNLRDALFTHLQSLTFAEYDKIGTSTMITRMTSDINQAQNGVNMTLRLFLRSPFVVFGAMIMAFTINTECALYFVLAIVLLSIVVFGIMKINIPLMKAVQTRLDEVMQTTRENLTGVRVLRAFCKEEEEIERFRTRNQALSRQQKTAGSISALTDPFTYIIINACIILLIYTGAVKVNIGILTKGQVVALYNYMSQILVELIKLANFIVTTNKALASATRIEAVFAIKPGFVAPKCYNDNVPLYRSGECNKGTLSLYHKVAFNHVNLRYETGGDEALTDINFTVEEGQIIGIIGGTGCGKTSLVHLLMRFYEATSGEVTIDGKNVKDYTKEELHKKVAIVMQKAVLFKGTIEENLRWGKKDATKEEMEKAIETAQAKDIVEAKGGLSAEVTQAGKNFSGGQKQRLTIARALVSQPEILILDDSASALDAKTDANLRKAIRELPNHPTVFIVSQRTNAIQDADKILVLDDGRIVGQGSHDELLKTCEIYKEIYESQYKKEGGR